MFNGHKSKIAVFLIFFRFALIVDERLLLQIPTLVRSIPDEEILWRRQRTLFVWRTYFSSVQTVVNTMMEVCSVQRDMPPLFGPTDFCYMIKFKWFNLAWCYYCHVFNHDKAGFSKRIGLPENPQKPVEVLREGCKVFYTEFPGLGFEYLYLIFIPHFKCLKLRCCENVSSPIWSATFCCGTTHRVHWRLIRPSPHRLFITLSTSTRWMQMLFHVSQLSLWLFLLSTPALLRYFNSSSP